MEAQSTALVSGCLLSVVRSPPPSTCPTHPMTRSNAVLAAYRLAQRRLTDNVSGAMRSPSGGGKQPDMVAYVVRSIVSDHAAVA